MSEAETDAFQLLTTQIRDLERRCIAVASAKATIFAFASTDASPATRGLVHADVTIRDALQPVAQLRPGKGSVIRQASSTRLAFCTGITSREKLL
jgi:hypothetical protein